VAVASLLVLGGAAPALAASGGDAPHAAAWHHREPLPASYSLPGDKTYPEGIARQNGTPFFYVGSTGDGTIYRGDVHQSATKVFLPGGMDGRTSVAGMKTDRAGRLIVAGGASGKVFVYDTRTRALLHVFDTGRTDTFLNDVALAPNGDAWAAATARVVREVRTRMRWFSWWGSADGPLPGPWGFRAGSGARWGGTARAQAATILIVLAQPWPASRICRAMCSSWKPSSSRACLSAPTFDRVQPAGGDQVGDLLADGLVVTGDEDVERSAVHLSGDQGRGERGVERLHDPYVWSRGLGDLLGGGGAGSNDERVE
jgi:hypothetical protein